MCGALRSPAGRAAGAVAGVAGPAAFTAAWLAASLLQPGVAATTVQISGLAAPGARYPWIMTAGFCVLGACLIPFGAVLRAELSQARRCGPAPWLIEAAGLLTLAAGVLRRDHMLLTADSQSWHNQAHNAVSAVLYVLLVGVPILLAGRFRGDPRWQPMAGPLLGAGLAAGLVLAVFASGTARAWDGTLQRLGVTISLAALAAVAAALARHVRRPPPGQPLAH